MSNKKVSLEIGLLAKPFSEQLKDFNIPKEQTDIWEEISNFIIRQSLNHNITQLQENKLFKGLFEEIKNYIKKQDGNKNVGVEE